MSRSRFLYVARAIGSPVSASVTFPVIVRAVGMVISTVRAPDEGTTDRTIPGLPRTACANWRVQSPAVNLSKSHRPASSVTPRRCRTGCAVFADRLSCTSTPGTGAPFSSRQTTASPAPGRRTTSSRSPAWHRGIVVSAKPSAVIRRSTSAARRRRTRNEPSTDDRVPGPGSDKERSQRQTARSTRPLRPQVPAIDGFL